MGLYPPVRLTTNQNSRGEIEIDRKFTHPNFSLSLPQRVQLHFTPSEIMPATLQPGYILIQFRRGLMPRLNF